jgi:hypothetical protein
MIVGSIHHSRFPNGYHLGLTNGSIHHSCLTDGSIHHLIDLMVPSTISIDGSIYHTPRPLALSAIFSRPVVSSTTVATYTSFIGSICQLFSISGSFHHRRYVHLVRWLHPPNFIDWWFLPPPSLRTPQNPGKTLTRSVCFPVPMTP